MAEGPSQGSRKGASRWETPMSSWVLCGVATLLLGMTIWPLWRPLLIAAVVAAVLQRFYERIVIRWGGRRSLTAAAFTFGTVLLILLPLAALVTIAIREALNAADIVRDTLASSGVGGLIEKA